MPWWKKFADKARGVFGSPASPVSDACCDHSQIHLRQGTAEFEEFVARGELETGNLEHGAKHLCNLLSYDPANIAWIDLLEKYIAAAGPDPESLIPRGERLYYSTEAVRAYIWHGRDRLNDAVELLVNVVEAKRNARYLEAWALNWLEPPAKVESLSEPLPLRLFALVLGRFPEAQLATLPRLRQMRRWAALSERCLPWRTGDGAITMVRAGLLRKAGRFDEAVSIAHDAMAQSADWHAATALGLSLWRSGKADEAEKAFQTALELDPDDLSARLEAGDMFLERGEWQRSLDWYDDALAKQHQHAWARPSALYCRWKITNDERCANELTNLATNNNHRARQLYYRIFDCGLPEPVDATANLLRNLSGKIQTNPPKDPRGEIRIKMSGLEAPSNYLAFHMQMKALGVDFNLKVQVEHISAPDPRVSIAAVKYLLWRYEGTEPLPALPSPPPDVLNQIAELAADSYDEEANWAAASRAAEKLGPSRASEILAAMVYPPALPKGKTALAWIPRVQLAAAQVAAQLDEGWEGSVRRELLFSVLFGPSDWTTVAAIRVLSRLGVEEEAFAPDIHDAFQKLADHRPDQGFCCWEHPLFVHWPSLPHLFPEERKKLAATLREIEAQNGKA